MYTHPPQPQRMTSDSLTCQLHLCRDYQGSPNSCRAGVLAFVVAWLKHISDLDQAFGLGMSHDTAHRSVLFGFVTL
jgi:hypothetical protein